MSFKFIWNDGKRMCLQHLSPYTVTTAIDGIDCEIHIEFAHHCFTDQKENGDLFKPDRKEDRFFSPERYRDSFRLPELVTTLFQEKDGHVTAYYNAGNQECYYHVDYLDYSVYMTIQKPPQTHDQLKVRIISAYEQDEWGRSPGGKKVMMYFLLSERLKGNSILKRKRR